MLLKLWNEQSQRWDPVTVIKGDKGDKGDPGGVWGGITGTLSNQTDLQSALNTKSTVSGTDDGTNWSTITINGTTKAIPSGISSVTWGQITGTLSNQTDLQTALSGKQPTISDLSDIRSGATAGSTAVQPAAIADMATKTWVGQQGFLTSHQSLEAYRTASAQDLIDANKQEVISDLSSIRSGASAGATAVQPAAISDMATQTWVGQQGYLTQHQSLSAYRTSSDQDVIDSTKASATDLTTHVSTVVIHRKITISTSDPSGGSDGDIWLKYQA